MEVTLFSLLAVFMVAQGLTILLILFLASRGTGLVLDLFQELDSKLAEAITKVVQEGGLGEIEAVNPIQAAIAQMLIGKMNAEGPHPLRRQRQMCIRDRSEPSSCLAERNQHDAEDHAINRFIPWPWDTGT